MGFFTFPLIEGLFANEATDEITDAQREASNAQIAEARRQFDMSALLAAPQLASSYGAMSQRDAMLGVTPNTGYVEAIFGGAGVGVGSGGGSIGRPDYAAYLESNPDVARSASEAIADPNVVSWMVSNGYDFNRDGQVTPEEYGRRHYETAGTREGRQAPAPGPSLADMIASPGGTGAPGAPAAAGPSAADWIKDPMAALEQSSARWNLYNQTAAKSDLDQVRQAIAAGGPGLNSGAALKELSDYRGRRAVDFFDTDLNNLSAVAVGGQTAGNQIANAGQQYGNTFNQATQNQANTDAAAGAFRWNTYGDAFKGAANQASQLIFAQ